MENNEFCFKKFWADLTDEEKLNFASAAESTVGYISIHITNGYKFPRKKLLDNLVKAGNGLFTRKQLAESLFVLNERYEQRKTG